jgi:pyruvate,water dikinase
MPRSDDCSRCGPQAPSPAARLVGPIPSTALALTAALLCTACEATGGEQRATEPTEVVEGECEVSSGEPDPDFLQRIGCRADFDAVASEPLDASIPGARSAKIVLDQMDDNAFYFQNSVTYPIHHDFAEAHLSGNGLPLVPALSEFNRVEYYQPDRRFVLGAVTYYEGPDAWTLEIAPYDTASVEMIEMLFDATREAAFFGPALAFHPTSKKLEGMAQELSSDIRVVTTDDLFAEIDYQPLNLGTAIGQLRFVKAEDLDTEFLGFREIVVLDRVPNDISAVAGLITEEFQTPLSHVNVLSQNRGTPNMSLRNATSDSRLRDLEGKWVELHVGAFEFTVREVTSEQADLFWEENKPEEVGIPSLDLSVTELTDIEDVLDPALELGEALDAAIPAFGGKASHYAAIYRIGQKVPVPKAFAVPVHFYWQFMEQNGFNQQIADMLLDEEFRNDSAVREQRLQELRDAMVAAPVDPDFASLLEQKLVQDYPGIRMRFRSSTNAEDLDGFTGAGLYISWTGAVGDPRRPVLDAVRNVWASVWFFRAFEEREYRSIDHQTVGMALLVHRSFTDEEANGVALTANPFDATGFEPGFYINVQRGEGSVVKPIPGQSSDQFIYHFDYPGQPIVFIARSNLVPEGCTVLTNAQVHELGVALDAIHQYFRPVYGTDPDRWYAMDVEFKFDGGPYEPLELFVKQARPHSGWGQ